MERIAKTIANNGYCSRRKAEELISKKKVRVNGEVINEPGTLVSPNDIIEVEGNILEKNEKVYILLNKPRGVVSTTTDDKNRKTVLDLINIKVRVYPIGRLDYDTTGVLLLTNDGELTNKLLHPSSKIEKVYIAKIKGIPTKGHINTLESGIIIDGKKTARSKVKIKKIDKKTNTSVISVTVHEGRNHQIKDMFKSLGYEVVKLRRERIGFLTAEGLKIGEYRYLNIKEVKVLYNLVNSK